ncbi:MAG TPA: GH25 family lysozyme [Candidatus Angelobacter sp.]|nr:GH25 family lysozyme [Candidatus Angelobacter sp.]
MPPANSFLLGIDVSSNQGTVDWGAVAQANISFAYVRSSLGGQSSDNQFSANWSQLNAAGLLRGAYHFFWPLAPAVDQANHYLQTVGTLASGDLPPMVDLEPAFTKQNPTTDLWSTIPSNNRLSMILDWLNTVEQALGLKPFIYTYKSFIENLLGDGLQQLSRYPLWIAHYTNAPQPNWPSAWNNWTLWQFTEKGQISGVNTSVDQDRFSGSLDDLKALAKP